MHGTAGLFHHQGINMTPSEADVKECLDSVSGIIGQGGIECLLCGNIARVGRCWIPTETLAHRLNTPVNRHRIVGFGLCDQCDMTLTEHEFDLIADRLSRFIRKTCLHMPRGKLPAIFLN